MIGSAGKAILTGLMEVLTEILICLSGTFRSLDHYKTDRTTIDLTFVLQLVPIDMPLMMGNVYTVDLIAVRIADITIERTPTETEWTDENIIEKPDVDSNNSSSTKPICPIRQMTQKSNKEIRLPTSSWAMIRMG